MRKIIAMILVSLMLLQAIPVLHFFSSHKAVFYAYVDEEKPEQKSKANGEDYNKHISVTPYAFIEEAGTQNFLPFIARQLSSPLLEALTPPPDAC